MYFLNKDEIIRFKKALLTTIAIPFIDGIEDFIVEAIWEYTKDIDGPDPFFNIRSKKLYDVVDIRNKIGWSIKSVQWNFYPGCEFELVIQRADVYKKSLDLGYGFLDKDSDPNLIGNALLKHWSSKVIDDAISQSVSSKRVMILLKTNDMKKFAIYEDDIKLYNENDIYWEWTNTNKNGLKGLLKEDDSCVYRWYPSQKQLFERFLLPKNVQQFAIVPHRLTKECIVEVLTPYILKHQ